jgi:hypothetical protein
MTNNNFAMPAFEQEASRSALASGVFGIMLPHLITRKPSRAHFNPGSTKSARLRPDREISFSTKAHFAVGFMRKDYRHPGRVAPPATRPASKRLPSRGCLPIFLPDSVCCGFTGWTVVCDDHHVAFMSAVGVSDDLRNNRRGWL